jgi:hypothetical protein
MFSKHSRNSEASRARVFVAPRSDADGLVAPRGSACAARFCCATSSALSIISLQSWATYRPQYARLRVCDHLKAATRGTSGPHLSGIRVTSIPQHERGFTIGRKYSICVARYDSGAIPVSGASSVRLYAKVNAKYSWELAGIQTTEPTELGGAGGNRRQYR